MTVLSSNNGNHRFRSLIVCDPRDGNLADKPAALNKGFNWFSSRFDELASPSRLKELRSLIRRDSIEMLVYSRNEQTSNPNDAKIGAVTSALRCGYSSFSAIDCDKRAEQTEALYDDLLLPRVRLPFASPKPPKKSIPRKRSKKNKTGFSFSLAFDVEQLGCVRYGLPRILPLLAERGIPASFFCTNFVLDKYAGLAAALSSSGHEVGVHGLCHEYLAGRSLKEQRAGIAEMLAGKEIKSARVSGANFIGRMDSATVEAIAAEGLKHFVFPLKNTRKFYSVYSPPLRVHTNSASGSVALVPIQAETYGKTWLQVKAQINNTLDSAGCREKEKDSVHLTVLLHPFHDGALENLTRLRLLLDYFGDNGFEARRIDEVVRSSSAVMKQKNSRLIPFRVSPVKSRPAALVQRLQNNFAIAKYSRHPSLSALKIV